MARSLNLGIAASSGDLVARMDDDDLSMPERISEQVKFMIENPSVDVLGTGVILVNDLGEPIKPQVKPQNDKEIKRALCRENPLFHPTVLMRRAFLMRVGGYNETLRRKEDYELWGRAAKSSIYHNLQEPLVHYRVKQYKTLKALPASVKVRLQNGRLMNCFFRALFWAALHVIISIARKYGYQQRAYRQKKYKFLLTQSGNELSKSVTKNSALASFFY